MANIYYEIWADAIKVTKKKDSDQWKVATLIPMSILHGVNLLAILFFLRGILGRQWPLFVPVKIFRDVIMNDAVSIILTFILPFLILNYLLIFNNDRYQEIIRFHKGKNGRLYKLYILVSLGIIVIPFAFKLIF
jgi:hypothetical protein